MIPTVHFNSLKKPDKGDIILFLFEGHEGGDSFRFINKILEGTLDRALETNNFTGKLGEICELVAPNSLYSHVLIVGLGPQTEFAIPQARHVGGVAFSKLRGKTSSITLMADWDFTEFAAHLVLGVISNQYRFDVYKTQKDDRKTLQEINVFASDYEGAEQQWLKLSAVIEGIFCTRDLVNEPSNRLNPTVFVDRIESLEDLGVEIEILDQEKMQELGFGALLGVAQGSDQAPKTVIMHWKGAPDDQQPPIAILGKGVTFDSGGISIKPANGMEDMKMDMAGAATVVGLMSTLAKRKANVNVIGVVGLVENMVSGNAQRPGDIVTSASGQTIEVLNTDAEGRLVLADILWYTQDRFKPRFMIDLATLTGAIVVSLGHVYAGLFTNNDELASQLHEVGRKVDEKLWRMPLGKEYDKALESNFADMKNIGGRDGGSITAAQFLQRFVNHVPWAHIDIAGTAYTEKDNSNGPKGATAFGVYLLNEFIETYYEN